MESIMQAPLETSTFPSIVDHVGLTAAPVPLQVWDTDWLYLPPSIENHKSSSLLKEEMHSFFKINLSHYTSHHNLPFKSN